MFNLYLAINIFSKRKPNQKSKSKPIQADSKTVQNEEEDDEDPVPAKPDLDNLTKDVINITNGLPGDKTDKDKNS